MNLFVKAIIILLAATSAIAILLGLVVYLTPTSETEKAIECVGERIRINEVRQDCKKVCVGDKTCYYTCISDQGALKDKVCPGDVKVTTFYPTPRK